MHNELRKQKFPKLLEYTHRKKTLTKASFKFVPLLTIDWYRNFGMVESEMVDYSEFAGNSTRWGVTSSIVSLWRYQESANLSFALQFSSRKLVKQSKMSKIAPKCLLTPGCCFVHRQGEKFLCNNAILHLTYKRSPIYAIWNKNVTLPCFRPPFPTVDDVLMVYTLRSGRWYLATLGSWDLFKCLFHLELRITD